MKDKAQTTYLTLLTKINKLVRERVQNKYTLHLFLKQYTLYLFIKEIKQKIQSIMALKLVAVSQS